jgi:hypothetical protein
VASLGWCPLSLSLAGILCPSPSPLTATKSDLPSPPTHPSHPHPTCQAPDTPTYVEVEFEKGDPVAIDGVRMSPATVLTELNRLGGDNGGRGSRVGGWGWGVQRFLHGQMWPCEPAGHRHKPCRWPMPAPPPHTTTAGHPLLPFLQASAAWTSSSRGLWA